MSNKKDQLRTTTKKEAMLEALKKHLGVVTDAVDEVGIDRTTHYAWMEDDPDYKQAVEDVDEQTLDFAESQLHKRIKEGSINATTFFLERKAKQRGYGKKVDINHSGSIDFNREPKALETVLKIFSLVESKQKEKE